MNLAIDDMQGPVAGKLHRLVFRSLIIAPVSVCIILGSWLFFLKTENQIASAVDQLRYTKVLLQRAEQELQRLGDASTHPLTRIAGEDIDNLQIRLAEFLQQYPSSGDVSLLAFEQSVLAASLPTAGLADDDGELPSVIQILRLDVEAVVVHAPALLALLDELEMTVAGWPVDVRACDIHRTPLQRLNARCVMDIYFWKMDAGK